MNVSGRKVQASTRYFVVCYLQILYSLLRINQVDIAEKNTQVSIMGCIFLSCEKVFGWLCRKADGSSMLLEYFAAIRLIGHYLPKLRIDHIKALVKLAQRDYWRRTWIVQDIPMKKISYLRLLRRLENATGQAARII